MSVVTYYLASILNFILHTHQQNPDIADHAIFSIIVHYRTIAIDFKVVLYDLCVKC